MLRRALVCLALVWPTQSCSRDEPTPSADTGGAGRDAARSAALRDAKTLAALASFGNEGSALLVVRPYAWPEMRPVLRRLLSGLDLPDALDPAGVKRPEDLPALLAAALGLAPGPTKQLAGWDANRPITASLFETDLHGPAGALTPSLDERRLPKVRHQLLLPATDVDQLIASLAAQLRRVGSPWPDLVEDTPGARAAHLGRYAVALTPEAERVRVTVVHPVVGTTELASVRARLGVTPVELPQSEAVGLLIARDNLIGTLLRPHRLRPLSVLHGAQLVRDALAEVPADDRATLRARATQVVLSSELVMSDTNVDVGDTAVSIAAGEDTLRIRMVSELTAQGVRIVDAAEAGAGGPFTTKAREPWLQAYVGANLRGLLDAATAPPALADSDTPWEVLQESGGLGTLYAATRFPFGLLDLVDTVARSKRLPFPLDKLPLAVQAVWTGLEPGELPAGAIAMEWPTGADTSAVTGLVSLARTDPAFAGLSVAKLERGRHPVTMVGSGVDATAIIHGSGATRADALAELRVDFGPIATAAAKSNARLGRGLRALGQLEARLVRRGDTLTLAAALTPQGKAATAESLVVSRAGTGPARRPGSSTRAERCLEQAAMVIAGGLRAITTVSPESLGAISAKVLAQAAPHLTCATETPKTNAAALALRRLNATLATEVMIENNAVASAAMVLDAECQAVGDEAICDRHAALATLPTPTPARIEVPAACGMRWDLPQPSARIAIDRRGIGVLDELVTAATLASRVGDAGAGDERPVELTVDRDTKMATVRPVLEALQSSGIERLLLSVDDGEGRRAIAVRVVAAAKSVPLGKSATWTAWTVDRAMVTRRGSDGSEHAEAIADLSSIAERARSRDPSTRSFVHAEDDARWNDVITILAGECPEPALTLGPGTP